MSPEYQPSLLSNADLRAAEVSWAYQQVPQAECSAAELADWQQRVHQFQRQVHVQTLFITRFPTRMNLPSFG